MTANVQVQYRDKAFSQRMFTFAIVNREHIDVREFFNEASVYFERELRKVLNNHESVKVNTCFSTTFEKEIRGNQTDADENYVRMKNEKQDLFIHTKSVAVMKNENLNKFFKESVMTTILQKFDDAPMRGSGSLKSINELQVQINRYDPLNGNSYIKLPKFLANKHAIVNVKNNDEKCFMWAVLSALHNKDIINNPERVKKYEQYQDELNFTGIEFPMQVNHIDKFEKLNDSISINVYMYDESAKKIYPLRITKSPKINHIHLMLLSQQPHNSNEQPRQHYCWIKDLSKLISSQLTLRRNKKFFCDRCLNYFSDQQKLEKHIVDVQTKTSAQLKCLHRGITLSSSKITKIKSFVHL